jgi:hypothetical protein
VSDRSGGQRKAEKQSKLCESGHGSYPPGSSNR